MHVRASPARGAAPGDHNNTPSIAIPAFAALLGGCGDTETTSELDVKRDRDGNAERVTAKWKPQP